MSFISKAVKKVFAFGKKIVKGVKKAFGNKWFRTAALVGLSLFTAGIASGGFAAFGAAQNAAMAAGSSSIGAFFSAVGTTVATGFSSVTGSLGGLFGGGGVDPLLTGGAGEVVKDSVLGEVAKDAAVGSLTQTFQGGTDEHSFTPPGAQQEKPGFLNRMFGSLFGDSNKSTFMRTAIVGGISFWAKQKEADRERRRRNKATIAGGRAFGSPAELPEGYIRKPIVNAGISGSSARELSVQGTGDGAPAFAERVSPTAQAPLLGKATQIASLRGSEEVTSARGPQRPLLGAG
jgi:hypothetical protein